MSDVVSALQRALAAEHDAVYVLATLGGRASSANDPVQVERLGKLYDAHEQRRDWLYEQLTDAGVTPTAAAPAYALPLIPDAAAIAAAAADLESRCAEHYAWLIEVGDAALRVWALAALRASAVASVQQGGAVTAFPGAAELTGTASAMPSGSTPSPD